MHSTYYCSVCCKIRSVSEISCRGYWWSKNGLLTLIASNFHLGFKIHTLRCVFRACILAVLAKYVGHARHVRQRALTLPDVLSCRFQYMENGRQGRQELPDIFADHQLRKMSSRGSKCPADLKQFLRRLFLNASSHYIGQRVFEK